MSQESPSSFGSYKEPQPMYPPPISMYGSTSRDYPSVNPCVALNATVLDRPSIVPAYPTIELTSDNPSPVRPIVSEPPSAFMNQLPLFTPEQILSMDELTIDCMSYLDINRLYDSVLMIHHRGLVDIQKFTDYAKLKQVEQLIVNALYKDTENWRIMLSSYDKCHRVNQARLAFLKEQYDKHKY